MTFTNAFNPENARLTLPLIFMVVYVAYNIIRLHKLRIRTEKEMAAEKEFERLNESTVPVEVSPAPEPTVKEEGSSNSAKEDEVREEPQSKAEGFRSASKASRRSSARIMQRSSAQRRERTKSKATEMFIGDFNLLADAMNPEKLANEYECASAGDYSAFVRLGEFAMRRGVLIESYYWFALAREHGIAGLDDRLSDIRQTWVSAQRPLERGNVYECFSPENASLARAMMELEAGLNHLMSRRYIYDVSKFGNGDDGFLAKAYVDNRFSAKKK